MPARCGGIVAPQSTIVFRGWHTVCPTSQDPPQPEIELKIICPQDQIAGVWANFASVSHSPYEFTLDFSRLEFDGEVPQGGIVVQRVSMSPLLIMQLIEALQLNYKAWAQRALPPEARAE